MTENTISNLENITCYREKAVSELEDRGYTVIPGVLTETECNTYIGQYKSWVAQFGKNDWPNSRNSVIQGYRIGHFKPSWNARLKTKPVFASLWETEKLLTSVDGIAVARPPEHGKVLNVILQISEKVAASAVGFGKPLCPCLEFVFITNSNVTSLPLELI